MKNITVEKATYLLELQTMVLLDYDMPTLSVDGNFKFFSELYDKLEVPYQTEFLEYHYKGEFYHSEYASNLITNFIKDYPSDL